MKTSKEKNFRSYLAHFYIEWEAFHTNVVDKFKTYIFLEYLFLFLENRTVYEIMWVNTVEPDVPQMTSMAHAHYVLDI